MFVFKVPSLRNIQHTAPYFHDGSLKTLDETINVTYKHQLGEKLTSNDVRNIKSFLHSLSAKSTDF